MISKDTAVEYTWGDQCKGWHLVKNEKLGVIQEVMPPGTREVRHKHLKAQQFFYILQGVATFELEGRVEWLKAGQGIHVPAGSVHQIKNETALQLEFLVVSEPHAHGDRESIA